MREFYFSGTPYPSNVEIGEDASNNPAIGLAEESNSDNILFMDDESDVELPDAGDELIRALGLERVLCNLASNTLIATTESPPTWFQPSEGESVS